MTVLVSLIGEQPIPNLLAIRAEQPDTILLVYSTVTKEGAKRLKELPSIPKVVDCPTEAYNLPAIRSEIDRVIRLRRWGREQLVFNLTGGTKTMALAAYEIAKSLRTPFLYLQSEGKQSVLYRYQWATTENGESVPVLEESHTTANLISLDEYIRAYVGDWHRDERDDGTPEGRRFEQIIREALSDGETVDELEYDVRWSDTMEADLVMRRGSSFAVAEIKQGRRSGKKDDLQQLAMIARQQVLGTYIQPIFILGKDMDYNIRHLAESFGIAVIEVPSWESTGDVSPIDCAKLRAEVRRILTPEGDSA